ncbi:MAG TPA: alpha/beta fold hydrolase [Planctomycetota bacterium]|nr:alpha/beta fold hydrolase [Planctomycetota bacterium]
MVSVFIPGPAGRLEASLWLPKDGSAPRAGAVVCHPHPLHGGTMHNNVVFRTARGLQTAGLAVLRFNFRGAGKSEGAHHGAGGEVEDAAAALDELERRFPELELWAAGFSFGARTAAALALRDERVARLLAVALPCRAYDCSFVREVRQSGLILLGERDDFGTLRDLRERVGDLPTNLEVDEIPLADHFFRRATPELERRVRRWAERALGVER